MLKVSVHNHHIIAFCVAKAGVHTGFLSEVSRKGDISYALVLVSKGTENFEGLVFGTVVDEKELKAEFGPLGCHAVGDLGYLLIELGEDLLFVITRNDYRNEFHTTPPIINKYTTNYTTISGRLQGGFDEFPKNLHKNPETKL